MVSNRMSSLMGETGKVLTIQTRMCSVLLDGDTEPLTFHLGELDRLP